MSDKKEAVRVREREASKRNAGFDEVDEGIGGQARAFE